MDLVEEDSFNVESSEATAELEELAREEAIGSTLYDKKWVIKTVLSLGSEDREVSHRSRGGSGFDLSYQQKFHWDMKF